MPINQHASIQQVRTFWDEGPCNIRHSRLPIGTEAYFNEVEKRKYFVEPHIPKFAQYERWKGKRVLEIGCGIGTDTISFARAGALVTAVDLSEKSLALAQKRAKVFGLSDRIRFHLANAEELSTVVPVQEFDLVYSFGVIHHTPRPRVALTEIKKYLGKESELRLMVYNRFSWKVLQMVLHSNCRFWKLDELIAQYSEAQEGCPVTYAYSKKSFEGFIAGLGLNVQEMFVDHIFPYVVSEYRQQRYLRRPIFRLMPDWMFRFLERTIGWHRCVVLKLS